MNLIDWKENSNESIEVAITSQIKGLGAQSAGVLTRLLEDDFVMPSGEDYTRAMNSFSSTEINKQRLLMAISYIDSLLSQLDHKYTYHNKAHSVDQVARNALMLAKMNAKELIGKPRGRRGQVSEKDMELLLLWALGHDLWFLQRPTDNEEIACVYMRKFMERSWYEEEEIKRVEQLIMSTTFGVESNDDLLSDILCDADMSHLADTNEEFETKLKNLYSEYKACGLISKRTTYETWCKIEPKFFRQHRYRSSIARFLYGDQELSVSQKEFLENSRKWRNLAYILKKIEDNKNIKNKKRIQP